MPIHRAVLVLVERGATPDLPAGLAELEDDEEQYLEEHVDVLRQRAAVPDALTARYQPGSDVSSLLEQLLTCTDNRFLQIAEIFASRLHAQMQTVTNPSPGILAVVTSQAADGAPDRSSVLKLDATYEAAEYVRAADRVRINVLRDLLPSPGELQKGLSSPDPRTDSDVIIRDRNVEAAKYFLNAFQVRVSPRPQETARALLDAIAQLPEDQIRRAYSIAARAEGQADTVVRELRAEFSGLDVERDAFGARGSVPGVVRPERIAARPLRVKADGFVVEVPPERAQAIQWEQVGDGWVIRIETTTRPRWEAR